MGVDLGNHQTDGPQGSFHRLVKDVKGSKKEKEDLKQKKKLKNTLVNS